MQYSFARSVFVYECDFCHMRFFVQNELEPGQCGVCGKNLCPTCNNFGVCHLDFAIISRKDQEKLKEITRGYDEIMAANQRKIKRFFLLIVIVAISTTIMVPESISLVFSNNANYLIMGLISPLLILYITPYWFRLLKQNQQFKKQKIAEQAEVAQRYKPNTNSLETTNLGNYLTPGFKICSSCGQVIPPQGQFCAMCGQRQ